MREIPLISIASVNACQNRCAHCAHQGIRDDDPSYQMPLDDVRALLDRLDALDCKVLNVSIAGPGEPLLWKHFNQAVRLLAGNRHVVKVEATTNGRALHVIEDDVWALLSPLYISLYGDPIDGAILAKHPEIRFNVRNTFWFVDESRVPVKSCSACGCPGATYYKGRIYPYCGPVLFDACNLGKVSPIQCSVPLSEYDPSNLPPMPYMRNLPCGWCWANPVVPKILETHRQRSGQ